MPSILESIDKSATKLSNGIDVGVLEEERNTDLLNDSGCYTDFSNTSLEHQQDLEIDSTSGNYSESSVKSTAYSKFSEKISSKLDNDQKIGRCTSSEIGADSIRDSDAFNSEDSSESTTTSPILSDEDEDQCRIDSYPGYGSRYGQLRYDHENTIEGIVRKEDSFSLAKVELSAKEREKYEDIWQKIDKVHDDLKRDCDKDEDYYEKCEKELDEIIDQALKQRIIFTFPYKGEVSFVDRIIDTLKKLRISYTDDQIYEFMDKTKILNIMSEGAYLNESTRENHEDYVNKICAERKTLKKKR